MRILLFVYSFRGVEYNLGFAGKNNYMTRLKQNSALPYLPLIGNSKYLIKNDRVAMGVTYNCFSLRQYDFEFLNRFFCMIYFFYSTRYKYNG